MGIAAQRGNVLRAKGWRQEGLLRLLENVLENGEDPENLIVYGALGKAARDWPSYHAIVDSLLNLEEDESLIVQSGKPIAVLKTHRDAPVVIMANSNLVGQWASSGLVGARLHTLSQGKEVKGNQMASTRPALSRKLEKVRPPLPWGANSSV